MNSRPLSNPGQLSTRKATLLASLATLGALLCAVLAPIQSAIWNTGEPGQLPIVVGLLPDVVAVANQVHSALGTGLGLTPYEFWGRMFVLVYVGAVCGVIVIRAAGSRGQLTGAASALLLVGTVVAVIGDVASYWAHGTALEAILWSSGFAVELTGLLLMLVGTISLGVASVRSGRRGVGAFLILCVVLAVPVTFLVRYMPHGTVLPIAIAIAGYSWFLVRQADRRAVGRVEAVSE